MANGETQHSPVEQWSDFNQPWKLWPTNGETHSFPHGRPEMWCWTVAGSAKDQYTHIVETVALNLSLVQFSQM